MKQNIRLQTFETNSSSYHTLSILKLSDKPNNQHKIIEKGQDIRINTDIKYKKIGYTESYSYTAQTNYQKAQVLLRIIAGYIDYEIMNKINSDDWHDGEFKAPNWDKYKKIFIDYLFKEPTIIAFIQAIQRYIGQDNKVEIEFNRESSPYLDTVSDDTKDIYEVLGIREDDLNNIQVLTDKFYDIIFSDEYEVTEECESNE